MRILLVDDDMHVLDILGDMLGAAGHTVTVADDASTAYVDDFIKTPGRFDVIVSDRYFGSGLTGVDLYRMLQPGHYRDKFVFFTSDIEGLPKEVPAVEKPDFQTLIATVEGMKSDG